MRLALIVSVVVHALVFAALYGRPAWQKDAVAIELQTKSVASGEKNVFEKQIVPKKNARLKAEVTARSSSAQGLGHDDHDSEAVSGEDLGIHAKYPRLSRVLGEKGEVLIQVERKSNAAEISKSSGFERIDNAAVKATQAALASGLLEMYLKSRETLQVKFIFKLSEADQ